jgi:hypothetical protein
MLNERSDTVASFSGSFGEGGGIGIRPVGVRRREMFETTGIVRDRLLHPYDDPHQRRRGSDRKLSP